MGSITQFLEMGGYGGYVWPAFGIVIVVMALLWIASMRSWRQSDQALASLRTSRRQQEGAEE